ncbi:hypothetical protein Emed_006348 [Eimeria media]
MDFLQELAGTLPEAEERSASFKREEPAAAAAAAAAGAATAAAAGAASSTGAAAAASAGGSSRGSHCLRVYELLREVVDPAWHAIPDPTSPAWLEAFKARVDAREPLNQPQQQQQQQQQQAAAAAAAAPAGVGAAAAAPAAAAAGELGSDAFGFLSAQEEFLLLSKVTSRIDTPWAQALRRLRAIDEAEASRPLSLTEVVEYAQRIAGSVAAPAESSNVVDPVFHSASFPAYHFLPYPSLEELQMSRLAALSAKPFADVCFPPQIECRVVSLSHAAVSAARHTPQAYEECLMTAGLWGDSPHAQVVLYELKITSPTPCCSFWAAAVEGELPPSRPLPPGVQLQMLPSLRPLLVPGPFPKTIRVLCRKAGKRDSRITQAALRLKGKAAAAAAAAAAAPSRADLARAEGEPTSRPQGPAGVAGAEGEGASRGPQGEGAAAGEAPREAPPSQFHGLMLGASRRRARRMQESSSESSSGSSSEGD